ncbi:ATP-binding response regulator [Arenicella xantha]|uniref:histidine kinase n=1 Tax=Arenicella xantha TaxID=644221 RepID=A0A395JHR9_9GAMM|nr:hybrid sensor histidine kinase/response regulator [Arenicella xantha]RBP49129.1 signal transduction histidine kinase [Arenicella xantha]
MPMKPIDFHVKKQTLEVLLNRRTPNWALLTLVLTFSFFYWRHDPTAVVIFCLIPNLLIVTLRGFWLYPMFDRAEVTSYNIDRLLKLYAANVALTGITWSIALPMFFTPANTLLLLVFSFVYFILIVSGTVALAAHRPSYFVYWLPFSISLPLLFFIYDNGQYASFGVGTIFFNIFILYLYNVTNTEVVDLIRVQLEKQNLAESLEEKRVVAEKAVDDKNRFLAAASHDLRQPLHTTGLLLSALHEHVKTETGQQLLEGVSNSMNALNNSFNSLLDVSKLDAGVVEVSQKNIPLHDLFQEISEEFSSQAEGKGIKFEIDHTKHFVYTDPVLLMRILRNLLSNAVKYTENGTISIVANSKRNGNLCISISDSGPGIPAEEADNIFSEYYQLHNPERDRNQGFGLGLAIVKRLCDLLDLPLTFDTAVGHGTTFKLEVRPGTETASQKPVETSANIGDLLDKSILVIDDDLSVLNGMDKLLTSWGCQVFCAESEDQAVALMSGLNRPPDVTIADYRLRNDKVGTDACQRIQEEFNQEIPSIIVTGDTSPERLQQVVNSGFQLLHKPVSPEQLLAVIHDALRLKPSS